LIIDDITPLQQYTPEVARGDAYLFEVRPAVQWLTNTQEGVTMGGAKHFRGQNPEAGTAISYYLPMELAADVRLTITDMAGEPVRTLTGPRTQGIHRVQWDLRANTPSGDQASQGQRQVRPPVDPGAYLVKLEVGGREMVRSILVQEDMWMNQSH
jgi:hypothetical protein